MWEPLCVWLKLLNSIVFGEFHCECNDWRIFVGNDHDHLDMMTTDFKQMFTTFRLLARHIPSFCKLLFVSFNDFFAWHLSLIRWHLAYEYSGCGVWALVCGGIWCACSCIGWKNEDSQVSTWLLKNPRFQRWQA